MKAFGAAFCFLTLLFAPRAAGAATQTRALLGVRLGTEVSAWLNEVETRVGKKVYAEFAELDVEDVEDDYTLGVSYFTGEGEAVIRVDESFRGKSPRLTEAVIAHELLHLRLRVRGYPLFLFSPRMMTKRGPAQEVEQSNLNDLVSLVEHRIFAAEMRLAGLDKLIVLANGLDEARRMRGAPDGQPETLNYARAVLEWDDPALLDELTRIHRANGWERSLADGRRLAEIIRASNVVTPAQVAPVLLRCLSVLYRAQFRVEADRRFALARIYPQMIVHAVRPLRPRGRARAWGRSAPACCP